MMDFSDTLFEQDILFEDSSLLKIRNLLKTEKGENPLCPHVGFDTRIFFSQKVGTGLSLASSITQYLSSFRCEFSGVSATLNSSGNFSLKIQSQQKILSFGPNLKITKESL